MRVQRQLFIWSNIFLAAFHRDISPGTQAVVFNSRGHICQSCLGFSTINVTLTTSTFHLETIRISENDTTPDVTTISIVPAVRPTFPLILSFTPICHRLIFSYLYSIHYKKLYSNKTSVLLTIIRYEIHIHGCDVQKRWLTVFQSPPSSLHIHLSDQRQKHTQPKHSPVRPLRRNTAPSSAHNQPRLARCVSFTSTVPWLQRKRLWSDNCDVPWKGCTTIPKWEVNL